jgi:hypothetical protein
MPRVLLAFLVALAAPTAAAKWRVELFGGAATSFDSRLSLRQDGFAPIDIDARWAARSFESPIYYAWRVGRFGERGGWAVQLVHLKVYLENTTPEVSRFSVSHGYNLLTLERAWERGGFTLWAGAGVVIAHPESTVRGRTRSEGSGGPFGGGYFVTGPAFDVGVGRAVRFGRHWRVTAEGRFSLARARVPIAGGHASVPNRALHALVGVGFSF